MRMNALALAGGACLVVPTAATAQERFVNAQVATEVRPADSVALLASFVERSEPGKRSFADGALVALALHADAQADVALEGLAAAGKPLEVRKQAIIAVARRDSSPRVRGQALFWLSQKAGQRAVGAITQAIDEDPELEVKNKAVFALSQLPRDEGVPLLLQQARSNRDRRVRQQALFWLGQSGDPRALALFEEILKTR